MPAIVRLPSMNRKINRENGPSRKLIQINASAIRVLFEGGLAHPMTLSGRIFATFGW